MPSSGRKQVKLLLDARPQGSGLAEEEEGERVVAPVLSSAVSLGGLLSYIAGSNTNVSEALEGTGTWQWQEPTKIHLSQHGQLWEGSHRRPSLRPQSVILTLSLCPEMATLLPQAENPERA